MSRIVAHRFELLEPIGQGGTGSVWVALDHERATLAAVKLLTHADAGGVVQFAREQAMRIRSEYVIAPYSWAAGDEQVAIAMPLRTGGSLAVLVADFGALPTRWIATLGFQAAQAISAVHAAGVLHRDITPANLLLAATGTDEPELALSDFGTAIAAGSPRFTGTGTYVGTEGYVAPEVVAGGAASAASDWYSFGKVLEFLGADEPEVDARLSRLAAELTSNDPARRPTDAVARLAAVTGELGPWRPGADDVEVLAHVDSAAALARAGSAPSAVGHRADREPTRRLAPTPEPAGHTESALAPAENAAPPDTQRASGGRATVFLAAALGLVGLALLVLAVVLAVR
ncbi:protein kinase [Epidermidibacterium keratini]|uniref:non-specific serine/threonine protein kinase n=1 Tax=Epidermidibacterium keratini TaxID=1891644 RepID=A0A7L4YQL1_9ACTN|nr:serine/threonine-protein kinase [Epidermidibacterium keratini]QHC01420.1 protein kinase [Epidermidibacterium keratini]